MIPLAPDTGVHTDSPMEAFLLSRSPAERALIIGDEYDLETLSEIRATVFPLVEYLYIPFRLFFSCIESIFLSIISAVHTCFRWLGVATWFCFQAMIYSWVENIFIALLQGFDVALVAMLPAGTPPILVSGLMSSVGISALKSFWYNISFLGTMKWMLFWRFGLWIFVEIVGFSYGAYNRWRDHIKRRA